MVAGSVDQAPPAAQVNTIEAPDPVDSSYPQHNAIFSLCGLSERFEEPDWQVSFAVNP